MIARICLMSIALSGVWSVVGYTQERDLGTRLAGLVVAFDQETAKRLHPDTVLGVLVSDSRDAYETINARALAMRHANYFVYQSGQASTLAAMYSERLQAQGLVAIELPRPSMQRQAANQEIVQARSRLGLPQARQVHRFRATEE